MIHDLNPDFSQSLKYFESRRRRWLAEGLDGKWAVIHGATLIAMTESMADAHAFATGMYGPSKCLVKQVERTPPMPGPIP